MIWVDDTVYTVNERCLKSGPHMSLGIWGFILYSRLFAELLSCKILLLYAEFYICKSGRMSLRNPHTYVAQYYLICATSCLKQLWALTNF